MTKPEWWQHVLPLVEKGLERNNSHTPDDVLDGILTGHYQLWPTKNSILVTQIVAYPSGKSLNAWLAAGSLKEIVELTPDIEAWGAAQGCNRAMVCGRDKWQAPLKALGYDYYLTVLTKDI